VDNKSYELNGTTVLELAAEGPQLGSDRDAVALVGQAYSHDAQVVVIPVERLSADFFELKTRVAGEILHRLVLYKIRVALLGDVSRHSEESVSFRDFVIESNRGNQIWFVSSVEELGEKLSRA
jgi:hypothetical protein